MIDGLTLQYACDYLKGNLDIAISALLNDSRAFEFLPQNLKSSNEILNILEDLSSYFPKKLQKENRDVVKSLGKEGLTINELGALYRNDKEIILSCIQNSPRDYTLISTDLKDDYDILLAGGYRFLEILDFAHESLQKNSDAIFEILKKHITVDYLRDERGDENIRKIKSIEIDDYEYYYETANFYPYIPKNMHLIQELHIYIFYYTGYL